MTFTGKSPREIFFFIYRINETKVGCLGCVKGVKRLSDDDGTIHPSRIEEDMKAVFVLFFFFFLSIFRPNSFIYFIAEMTCETPIHV